MGQLAVSADPSFAYPGGLLVVRLRRSLGTSYAILDGKRVPFLDGPHGPLALVPIPVTVPAGPATLGIEILTRRGGRQRVPMDVPIVERSYQPRSVAIPEAKRALTTQPGSVADGRRLLLLLRTVTPQLLGGAPFQPPVAAPATASFGARETPMLGVSVDWMIDGLYGEYHRGVDYDVPAGTVALAPAAGTVLLAAPLALSGQTLVIDHGLGVVSALFHLSRLDVHEGDHVEARTPIGLTGDTGLTAAPHLHWAVYVHGSAVDPAIFERLREL